MGLESPAAKESERELRKRGKILVQHLSRDNSVDKLNNEERGIAELSISASGSHDETK